MSMHISSLYAGIAGIILIALTLRVTTLRQRFGVGFGSGDQQELARAIRVHANFTEYTPLALILLVLTEGVGESALLVHICGSVLIVSRLLHAWGLSHSSGRSLGRFIGTLGSVIVILVLSLTLISHVVADWLR